MIMKTCNKCKKSKCSTEFGRNKTTKDSLHYYCKECHSSACRSWRQKHPEDTRTFHRNWEERNPEINKAIDSRANAKWKKSNAGGWAAISAKYRAAKIKRTPSWLTASHLEQIRKFYVEAEKLSKELGIKMSVDHITPLQGENVSGLHVPWNLQIISRNANSAKGNRL